MSLAQQIMAEIKDKLSSEQFQYDFIEPVAELFIESGRELSREGKDATGRPFVDLVDEYKAKKMKSVGTSTANLHYGSMGAVKNQPSRIKNNATLGAWDVIDYTATRNSIDINFGDYTTISNYMEDHQSGGEFTGRKDLPQRKWIPETEQDLESPPQQVNIREMSRLLGDYLNMNLVIDARGQINISI
jgi:hypothetical protein